MNGIKTDVRTATKVKHFFINNPGAGTNDSMEMLKKLTAPLNGKADYSIYNTSGANDATRYVRSVCESTTDNVVFYACGGDGTINEVANGAFGFPHASVGCIPCGSGNDFVKYYGGSKAFLNTNYITDGETAMIDLLYVNGRYCVNACHFGFDSAVAETMNKVKPKKIIGGKHAYTTGVAYALVKAMKNECSVYVDGELLNPGGKMLLCTASNGRYVGGEYKCAPYSFNDDGLIEVCLITSVSRLKFIRLLDIYRKGEHITSPSLADCLVYRRGRRVDVSAADGFSYSIDGEIVKSSNFTVEIKEKCIGFRIPKRG